MHTNCSGKKVSFFARKLSGILKNDDTVSKQDTSFFLFFSEGTLNIADPEYLIL